MLYSCRFFATIENPTGADHIFYLDKDLPFVPRIGTRLVLSGMIWNSSVRSVSYREKGTKTLTETKVTERDHHQVFLDILNVSSFEKEFYILILLGLEEGGWKKLERVS